MLNTSQRVAAGWYPDPYGELRLRRWDGERWTEETRESTSGDGPSAASPPTSGDAADLGALVGTQPETGWASVAVALRSALTSDEAVRVTIALAGRSALIVNTFNHSYTWLDEPEVLPPTVENVQITFTRSEFAAPGHGRSLDGLLWKISMAAFPERIAPWLQPDDLYRMQRWPNLTTINPELDDMRQAAMLANGMFTVEELAGFSDRALPPTRSLINALSLMNTLKIAAPRTTNVFVVAAPASAPAPTAEPARRVGLFQRLRDRLGL